VYIARPEYYDRHDAGLTIGRLEQQDCAISGKLGDKVRSYPSARRQEVLKTRERLHGAYPGPAPFEAMNLDRQKSGGGNEVPQR
jgi:hypothetical protein